MTILATQNRKSAARELARIHRERDQGLRAVRWYLSGPPDEIRLLEATSEVSTTNEVFPVRFKAQVGFPFSTVIVLASPAEFDGIASGELELPEGWGDHFEDL